MAAAPSPLAGGRPWGRRVPARRGRPRSGRRSALGVHHWLGRRSRPPRVGPRDHPSSPPRRTLGGPGFDSELFPQSRQWPPGLHPTVDSGGAPARRSYGQARPGVGGREGGIPALCGTRRYDWCTNRNGPQSSHEDPGRRERVRRGRRVSAFLSGFDLTLLQRCDILHPPRWDWSPVRGRFTPRSETLP